MINALKMLLIMTVITGLIYPLLVTGIAQMAFPFQSNGSIIKLNGVPVGSSLIGQKFDAGRYIWPRPSAVDYNPLPSGGSNCALTNKALQDSVRARTEIFSRANRLPGTIHVPSEMLFASGSGLDPDITPANAKLQLNRVCDARNWSQEQRAQASKLIDSLSEKPQYLLFGERRINVLLLNLGFDKIDRAYGRDQAGSR